MRRFSVVVGFNPTALDFLRQLVGLKPDLHQAACRTEIRPTPARTAIVQISVRAPFQRCRWFQPDGFGFSAATCRAEARPTNTTWPAARCRTSTAEQASALQLDARSRASSTLRGNRRGFRRAEWDLQGPQSQLMRSAMPTRESARASLEAVAEDALAEFVCADVDASFLHACNARVVGIAVGRKADEEAVVARIAHRRVRLQVEIIIQDR